MALAGQHVIVVGGSSGIGLAVASAVLAEGGRVTIVGRSEERLVRARKELGEDRPVSTVAADIAGKLTSSGCSTQPRSSIIS